MSNPLVNFLEWVQSLFLKKPVQELPKVFDKAVATCSWREGLYSCEGILPNHTKPNYFYSLEVKPVRAVRNPTSYEIRCQNENARSQVPTHQFRLTYRQALIVEGKAVSSSPIPVFKIETSCWLPKKPTTDANWNAVMKIAPLIVDEIVNICSDGQEEDIVRLTGIRLEEGQKLNNLKISDRKSKVEYFKQFNKRKLLLTAHPSRTVNKSEEWWRLFITNALKEIEKIQ